eukprot:CAMPEP_0205913706 /NCGR_PEP_ID=MMETSP1325-20131115/6730_1 /ASSEMBLY_ACC=CAM_ASM_000708 /TAXON_ID=236786 /ORGANISM="Florenciella sp., Strain RCC1007" /LENGTH=37 /DNA_ID= /DNA_START= /DNA_END= /DNA_ORIENTATION=
MALARDVSTSVTPNAGDITHAPAMPASAVPAQAPGAA